MLEYFQNVCFKYKFHILLILFVAIGPHNNIKTAIQLIDL